MKLIDQHVHSAVSSDCSVPMKTMAAAAAAAGIARVTFTDHCDTDDYITGKFDPDCWRPDELRAAFDEAQAESGGRVGLRLGAEIGGINHNPEKAAEISCSGLDIVLASVHNLRGMADFYTLGRQGKLFDREQCKGMLEQYAREHYELAAMGGFDVVAHIGYPLRYMAKAGSTLSLMPQREIYAEAFRLMAQKGMALELNTSGLRYGTDWAAPVELLKLFRELGGELVTLGSDAHEPQYLAQGFKQGAELLKSVGFRYIAVYSGRKCYPERI